MCLDTAYLRSRMGLTIALVWDIKSAEDEAPDTMDEDNGGRTP